MFQRRSASLYERCRCIAGRALCDTLVETGPEAPTLCVGWLTADLAAHLPAGEATGRSGRHHPPRTVRAAPQKVMEEYKAKGYDRMITELAPAAQVLPVGPMATVNVVENWIHHEDVRRPTDRGRARPTPRSTRSCGRH